MKIIVAQEKHATRYLDASTDEAWARSSLKLLKERLEYGYYNMHPGLGYDIEEIQRVVEEEDTSIITIGKNLYAREIPLAWSILHSRRDAEYEYVAIVEVEM